VQRIRRSMPNGEASKRSLLSLLCGPAVMANRSRRCGRCQRPALDPVRDHCAIAFV
jgi:hypothetical protein